MRPLEGVRDLRNRRMLSQQELADRAGVSLFTVQRIERGEGSVRPKTGRAIADALSVGVEDLLGKAQAPLPFEKGIEEPSPERCAFDFREARRLLELYCERWEKRLADGAADDRALEEFMLTAHGWIPVLDVALTAEVNELPAIGDDSDILRRSEIGRANERYLAVFDQVFRIYMASSANDARDDDTVVRIDEAREQRERLKRAQHRAVG